VIILNISKLLDLTPAESLMILDDGRSSSWKMVAVTFADLIMKKIIGMRVIRKRNRGLSRLIRGPFQIYMWPGKYYGLYDRLKPHERALARCICTGYEQFRGRPEINMGRAAFNFKRKEVGLAVSVHNYLLDLGYFRKEGKKLFSLEIYHNYPLAEKGLEAQARIKELLKEGASNMERWIHEEPARARAYLNLCGGNVLLIENQCNVKKMFNWSKGIFDKKTEFVCDASYYDYSWYDYSWGGRDPAGCIEENVKVPACSFKPGFASFETEFLDDFYSFEEFEDAIRYYWNEPEAVCI
jgi:hypothetical protein